MLVKAKIKSVFMLLPIIVCIGCQNRDDLGRFSALPIIKDYLSQKVADKGFEGKVYCAYEVLDTEKSGTGEKLYLWAVCQEFYRKNQQLETGTGGSFPVALTIQQQNEQVEVVGHQKPRDGSYYAPDLIAIFSKKAFAAANSVNNGQVNKLQNVVKQAAELP